MSPTRSEIERLQDIAEWGARLQRHLRGMTRDRFETDELAQDAAIRCIEVLGEAATRLLELMPELERDYPELELQAARATRNRIAHGFFDLNLDILWDTARTSVPAMIRAAEKLLKARGPVDESSA
jgi:uncharacterized protein with HEPN domain